MGGGLGDKKKKRQHGSRAAAQLYLEAKRKNCPRMKDLTNAANKDTSMGMLHRRSLKKGSAKNNKSKARKPLKGQLQQGAWQGRS